MTRKRRLSGEDLALWRKVARSTNPLHSERRMSTPVEPPRATAAPPRGDAAPAIAPGFRIVPAPRYDHSKGHDLSPTLESRLAAQPVRMDHKTLGRMKKGKLRPERKIDLHGMTLERAHTALARFIISAHADGCRLVLVVTGKGKTRDEPGPIPTPRGVLRNQVPQWLQLAPLGALVLQVVNAHVSHGGTGAYYVYLARRRG